MSSDKTFQFAFLISVIAHSVILIQNSNLALFSQDKRQQKLETNYVRPPQETKAYPRAQNYEKEQFLKLPSKITADKRTPPPFIDKENALQRNKEVLSPNPTFTKPEFTKTDIIAAQKKITLPHVDMDKINNPSYISYYQIVREKIRRAAYRNYIRNEVGEVYLSFIISKDGDLKEVRLSEEKSSSNPYLQEVSLRSMREASPFPAFPKELDYPQLSFNVVISYEIE